MLAMLVACNQQLLHLIDMVVMVDNLVTHITRYMTLLYPPVTTVPLDTNMICHMKVYNKSLCTL